ILCQQLQEREAAQAQLVELQGRMQADATLLQSLRQDLDAERRELAAAQARVRMLADALGHARDVALMPAEEQQREFERAERAHQQAPDEASALRLALLLSQDG